LTREAYYGIILLKLKIIFNKKESFVPFGPRWLEARFRGCGFRWTFPRQVILDVLTKEKKHLSAEDIFLKVHKRYPGIGLTTVYRTLELLFNMGLVRKYEFGDGRARFELSQGPGIEHHHHLICRKCGKIIDYKDFVEDEQKLIKDLEERLSKKHNFKIETHQIHFYGLCSNCS